MIYRAVLKSERNKNCATKIYVFAFMTKRKDFNVHKV